MSSGQAYSLQREQLRAEIRVVEVILRLVENPKLLAEASEICVAMMVLRQTNSFSFIDIGEYEGYLSDIESAKKNNDAEEIGRLTKVADKFLEDTLCDLQKAKDALALSEQ